MLLSPHPLTPRVQVQYLPRWAEEARGSGVNTEVLAGRRRPSEGAQLCADQHVRLSQVLQEKSLQPQTASCPVDWRAGQGDWEARSSKEEVTLEV